MKWFFSLVLLVGVVGCSNSTSSTATTAAPAVVTTSTVAVAPTTTVVEKLNPASGEPLVDCDNKAIGANYGEKLKLEYCTATWAMGDTDNDTWNCPKTGCKQTRLYHLMDNKWSTTAICHRDQPLTRYAISCYIPNAGGATLAEIPPSDVACAIWVTNRDLAFVEETGCTASKADIDASLRGECSGYFTAVSLPLEKCDQGAVVTKAQKLLRGAGYMVSVDGYFGPAMAVAVYKFQGKKSLTQMGIINEATWKALTPDPFPG
ncbi:MAG: hypothetical protein RLZZ426_935 [Actinomycetota bacterium]